MDKIIILDFGSQYTQLIGRRIRELGVYSEILPGERVADAALLRDCVGIVLSGSPYSAWKEGSPSPGPGMLDSGLPLLAICYGIQWLTIDAGGSVERREAREYGSMPVRFLPAAQKKAAWSAFTEGLPERFVSWMSHGDSIVRPGNDWETIGVSEAGAPAILAHATKPWFGLQFHPEVSHCEHGMEILSRFVFNICGARRGWSMEAYLEEETGASGPEWAPCRSCF
jgi:GMP synthase (glutamine-hydrolysing)